MSHHAVINCPVTGYSYNLPSPIPLEISQAHPITSLPLKKLLPSFELANWSSLSPIEKELLFCTLLSKNPLIKLPSTPLSLSPQLLESQVSKAVSLTIWINNQTDINYLPLLSLESTGGNLPAFLTLIDSEKRRIILAPKQLVKEKTQAEELQLLNSRKLVSRYESRIIEQPNTLPISIATHLLIASNAPKVVYKYWFSILTKTPSALLKWSEYNRNDCDELLEWFEQWDSVNPLKIVAIKHLRAKLESTPAPLTLDDLNLLVILDPLAEQESNEAGETKDLATTAQELLAKLKAKKKGI